MLAVGRGEQVRRRGRGHVRRAGPLGGRVARAGAEQRQRRRERRVRDVRRNRRPGACAGQKTIGLLTSLHCNHTQPKINRRGRATPTRIQVFA